MQNYYNNLGGVRVNSIITKAISETDVRKIYDIEEDHFNDFKAKDISGNKLSKTVSAFANASGGDIYIGIREENDTKIKHWEGFNCVEDANFVFQMIESISTVQNYYEAEFLKHPVLNTLVLRLNIFKSKEIVKTTDEKIFVRRGAQNIPALTDDQRRRLELDKGITSYENEPLADSEISDVIESNSFKIFYDAIIPEAEPVLWLKKQRLLFDSKLTVAAELLFSDEPQICLPKRSSIKIFRYKTSGDDDRDTLADQPITIEGSAYQQIYKSVEKVKEIISSIKRIGVEFEEIDYPEEALHEIITNAVLHRDYSIATDIQIRIYDNRVEVESPGKLPGHVTVQNILRTQAARNPRIVRLINKFPDAPNKDVGEGLNTAFDAMKKLRLKEPHIEEKDNSVLVIIKHEKLASPEELIVEYLLSHDSVKNRIGREVTGIKSENTMKNVFYRLRERGFIELAEGYNWIKTDRFMQLVNDQFPELLK